MRPPKRPTNQYWISLRKKVFQRPLKEANRGQEQQWPESANFEILLWISYVRIIGRQKSFKNSNWKRLQWPQKFNTFTRMGLMYFWLILDNDLCWGQIEGFEKYFCTIWSNSVWIMPLYDFSGVNILLNECTFCEGIVLDFRGFRAELLTFSWKWKYW